MGSACAWRNGRWTGAIANGIHDADAFSLPHTARGGREEEEEMEEYPQAISLRIGASANTYADGGRVGAWPDVGDVSRRRTRRR